jgi:hypothetical protein
LGKEDVNRFIALLRARMRSARIFCGSTGMAMPCGFISPCLYCPCCPVGEIGKTDLLVLLMLVLLMVVG